jgi:hypothetical protein
MLYDDDGRKALELLKARAACKLAEIHQILAPGVPEPCSMDELQKIAEGRLARMSEDEGNRLRLKAMVAYAELDRLVTEMTRHLDEIGEELTRVNRRNQALEAYRRAPLAGGYAVARH